MWVASCRNRPGSVSVQEAVRRLAPVIIFLLAGCQSTTSLPAGSSSRSATPSSVPSTSASTPLTSPVVVVANVVDQTHYTVTLADIDGHPVAQASASPGDQDPVPFPGSAAAGTPSGMADPGVHLVSFTLPRLPNAGVCCDAFLPTLSTSKSRVYFPDGLTAVRFLGRDGSTGTAVSLPNVAHRARAIFAVSPDDQRIAVSVFDWSTRPMKMRIYVEDVTGGGHHVEIFSSTSLYEWPVGWHDGKLVLGGGPALGGAPNPYAASWYHLVDATTGSRIAVLGGDDCPAVGPLSVAGTACIAAGCHCIEAVDWSGSRRPTYVYNDPSESNWAALSPDGHAVIFGEIYGARTGAGVWRDGTITWMKGYDQTVPRAQWLDDLHTLVSTCSAGGDQCIGIQTLANQAVVQVQVAGGLAGTLPGGL